MDFSSLPTIVHILKARASRMPDANAFTFLEDGEDTETRISYAELDCRARRLAATMQLRNPQIRNDRVVLIYPQGIEFIVAFFACQYAGATAVLVYPPMNQKMALRLNGIAMNCRGSMVLSTGEIIAGLEQMADAAVSFIPNIREVGIFSLDWLDTVNIDAGLEDRFVEQDIAGDDIAFLQYTSGSTGTPKGVMISHDNLMANQRSIGTIYGTGEGLVGVGWLPMIHDMGLIGNVLHPVYAGGELIFMSPLHFIQKPVRWLKAIDKYRATHAGGPNFAYDLCARKIKPETVADLDLSCWDVAFNGAEPVRRETVERFNAAFAQCGLKPQSHMAVYGLAEATLIVSGTDRNEILTGSDETPYMPAGTPDAAHKVCIVDPASCQQVDDGQMGEIWVSGPSVAQGYWDAEEATRETFHAEIEGSHGTYLRTGDTGFVRDGMLHVTGRIKDVIIIQGRNYHAEDVEWSLSEIDGVRPGCYAAFSTDDADREELVVVAGTKPADEERLEAVATAIRTAVYADHQLHVNRVVLIVPKALPTTTSGKVQRRLAKKMLLKDQFEPLLDQTQDQPGAGSAGCGAEPAKFVAPGTDDERRLVAIWADLLELPADQIGIHDNFFQLGGSSLTMVALAARLDEPMELLFRYPTISGYLYRTSEYEFPDVEADIWLPAAAIDQTLAGTTGISLITGGTGFFGLHFLRGMMKRSDDSFVLIVRAKNDEERKKKFDDAVDYFDMRADIDPKRVILVDGDLSKPHVGIPDEQYAWCVENVDKIFHIASHVNNWLPYEGIRQINVNGTRSLIELARTGRKKEFHYTSTSTFSPDKTDQSVFLEGDDIDVSEINRYFGYDISKYASEALCKRARAEGLVSNIYRLVWVGGQIASGRTKINDGLNIALRILLTLKVYPQGNYLHDIVPVDLMGEAMASIQGKAKNVDFNVTSQSRESIDMKRIVVMLKGMGYELSEVSRGEFVERLKTYPVDQWDEYCKSYRQLIIRLFEDPTAKVESFYDSTNFRTYTDADILAELDRKFVDSWFEKTVSFLTRKNALPTPSGQPYETEMAQIAAWNRTAAPMPTGPTLHTIFAAQAARTPDAVALRFEGVELSYRELERDACVVARNLLQSGVKPGDFVGLSVSRSPALIAAIFGIFKAGAAYVPLDPSYPVASLDFMIDDCGTDRILVDAGSKAKLSAHAGKLMDVDASQFRQVGEGISDQALTAIANDVRSDSLAYVVYTSGTTGKPKGVMVEHRNVVNHNLSIIDKFGLTGSDTMLQFSTVNFDSFVEEVFPTLFVGATLVLVRKSQLTDLTSFRQAIIDNSVNVLKFSTAFWHAAAQLDVEALGVRLVGIGGEEASAARYAEWRAINPGVPLLNTYGPTEITVTASIARLEGPQQRLTIGKPIRNTQLHVLDAQRNPVPIGMAGELYIGGAGVTRGYLNRPEATAAAFLDNPFVPGGKLYKTGDLARWTADGSVEFLGRSDNQVKVRGYRIELGAIESVLSQHEAIRDVAVVVKELATSKKIVAWFTSDAEAVSAMDLRAWLEDQLPGYMIPNLMLRLPEIPMNPNGKVDRKVLEDLEIHTAGDVDFSTPTSIGQIRMAAIWEKLLGVSDIGLNDDFLELGGHSLLVISLINDVREQFGVTISVNDIYENPTVGKLVAAIERETGDAVPSNLIRFPQRGKRAGKKPAAKARHLFMVHGLGGHLASYYPLVKNLKQRLNERYDMDIDVFGLEANGLKDDQDYFSTGEEMVATYLEQIRDVQPQGPYWLGGWSYGVRVAYQIAETLIGQGETVEMFISIDAEAPKLPKDFEEFMQDNGVSNLDDLYEDATLTKLLTKFGSRFGFAAANDECPKRQFHRFLGYSDDDTSEQLERFSKVAISNLYNARGFKPARISPANTLLVRASNSSFDNYMDDWCDLVGSEAVTSITLNGDHWSIMQDPELAEQLASHVANTELAKTA